MTQCNREAGISQKYDSSLDYGIDMYDHLPYERNSDVCNSSAIAMFSGHVIKYYLCKNSDDAFSVDNKDDQIQEILRLVQEKEQMRLAAMQPEPEVISSSDTELTDAQLQALTMDPSPDGNASADVNEPAETTGETINLDDIEDW